MIFFMGIIKFYILHDYIWNYLHLFSDSDNESTIRIVFKIKFIYQIGNKLKKSTSTLAEISGKSFRFFIFFEIFHFETCFCFYSASRITHFHIDIENPISFTKMNSEAIFIKWKTSIFDGVIYQLI